jgi:hypothetical protein
VHKFVICGLETQNLNLKSITKSVLEKSKKKKIWKKTFCQVLFQTSGFAQIDGPVTFFLYDLKC